MENLLKKLRVRFSDEIEEDAYNTQEGRIPPLKTVPFKKERKKATSWFRRQFSDQKGEEYDSADLEFGAAVAAAAYAIMLDEEEGLLGKKKPNDELGRTLTKSKTRREDSVNRSTDNRKISRWFSAKEAEDDDDRVAGTSFKKKTSTLEERMKKESASNQQIKEKAMSSIPSIKKTPTFSDKYLNDTDNNKPFERGQDRQSAPRTKKPMPSYSNNGFPNGDRTQSTNGLKKAYLWEQAKMEKIRKRHEKMNNTILQWENEKKVKAKRRMERKERKLEMKRTRILQEFHEEMKRIDMIASGARAVANEAKRNDELKAKERAKKMQSTVKVRKKCFFF